MKRVLILLLLLKVAAAQNLGSKTPYTAPLSAPPIPAGYTPFYIDHVGRHGARHVTNLKELTALEDMLSGPLTEDGRVLKMMVDSLLAEEQAATPGSLTQRGIDEQNGLGRRMASWFPAIAGGYITVTTTKEARTRQSADAFLKGLGHPATDLGIDSIHLRFFSLSPEYRAFEKKATVALPIPEAIVQRMFTGNYPDARAFALAVYAAACLPPGDIFRLLKPGEADQLALADGAKDFLVKGPGVDVHGIQVRIAAPLLEDFLRTASERLADGKPGADLRFGHAETIAPIAALMGIEGAATPDTELAQYTDVWQADRVMVFSGNIQWVFFRKPGADDLVEVLFNERPVHIPVPAASFPFYRWVDVKKYYSALLKP